MPCFAVLTALIATPAAEAATRGSWNLGQQEAVAAAGLLPRLSDGRFHGERPLTGAQLTAALAALTQRPPAAASAAATVSVTGFDARLVRQLGLADVAAHVQREARAAGLAPPRHFGTEVVARAMGLRTNHRDEALELYPWEPITRAEAAHSLATALRHPWAAEQARAALSTFSLPRYGTRARRALRTAVAKIGMPYIWGGETDRASNDYYGPQVHGGYDCSGLVWRVFKIARHPAGAGIRGRTAAQMAGEIRKGARLRLDELRPGDLAFFGRARFGSKATEANIVHVGIALSPQWMIHASGQGVYVSPLQEHRFAWGRRVR
jgi:cell wall-associated NlpC family hydrolase